MRLCEGGGAFTLIELLVVIAILALLMGILLPVPGRAGEGHAEKMSLEEPGYFVDASGTVIADETAGNNRLWSGIGRDESQP